jgi:nitroreductase
MNKYINPLKWRYSVKKFDTNKKINSNQLQNIIKVAVLTPSSFGIQPYKIIIVNKRKLKNELQKFTSNKQISQASHILIFAIKNNFNEKDIIHDVNNMYIGHNIEPSKIQKYKQSLIHFLIKNKSSHERNVWQKEQVYILLGILIYYCALEKIDTCPIGGFSNDKFDEILKLNQKNLKSVVILAVGYRDHHDKYQLNQKIRKSIKDLIINY